MWLYIFWPPVVNQWSESWGGIKKICLLTVGNMLDLYIYIVRLLDIKKLSLPYCIWPYHSERNAWNLDSMKKKRNRNISTRQLYVLCQSRGQISEQEMTVLSGRQTAAKRGEEDLLYSLKSSPWKTTTLWFGNWIDWA